MFWRWLETYLDLFADRIIAWGAIGILKVPPSIQPTVYCSWLKPFRRAALPPCPEVRIHILQYFSPCLPSNNGDILACIPSKGKQHADTTLWHYTSHPAPAPYMYVCMYVWGWILKDPSPSLLYYGWDGIHTYKKNTTSLSIVLSQSIDVSINIYLHRYIPLICVKTVLSESESLMNLPSFFISPDCCIIWCTTGPSTPSMCLCNLLVTKL